MHTTQHMSLSLTVPVWSCVGQFQTSSRGTVKRNKRTKETKEKKKSHVCTKSAESRSDHRALLLPEVRMRRLVVGRDHVGRVPPTWSWRALHHHQPDGRLSRLRVRGVLLRGIFAPAVVHDTRYQEDQEQDNVAGDEDAKVQSDGVDLLVVLQKAHGACFMLGGPEASQNQHLGGLGGRWMFCCYRRRNSKTSLATAGRSPSLSSSSICLPTVLPRSPSLPPSSLPQLLSLTSPFQMSAADTWLCGKNTLIRNHHSSSLEIPAIDGSL